MYPTPSLFCTSKRAVPSSLAEAIEWAKKCPNPMPEESDLEIRQVFEAEDSAKIHARTPRAGRLLRPQLGQEDRNEREGKQK
jgi:hypothetical protein